MRRDAPGGPGFGENHGRVQRETANAGLALALAGEAPIDGTARTGRIRAAASFGEKRALDSLRKRAREK